MRNVRTLELSGTPEVLLPTEIPKLGGYGLETKFEQECVSSIPPSPASHSRNQLGFPRNARWGRKSQLSRIQFRLRTPNSPILRWKSPKVSGLVRGYSRFAETIGG